MMNFKMKNKTLFLCLPAMLNIPFGGSSAFGANSEKDNKENSPKRPNEYGFYFCDLLPV
jgi:hypothetical protein